jgi:hypothetical protein
VTDATLETAAPAPELGEARITQLRKHLLSEIEQEERQRERRRAPRSRLLGRRRVLIIAVILLAAMYAVPAVAEERWWWVSSPEAPMQPVTQVLSVGQWTNRELALEPAGGSVPAVSFSVAAKRWTFHAFVAKEGNLCVGISPDPPQPANEGAFVGCGHPVHGIPLTYTPDERHWVGWGTAIPGRVDQATAKFMFGPAAPNVRYVDLENEDGRVLRIPTLPAPDGLGVDARFWIAVPPMEQLVHTIVPRDEDGKALERWRLPIAQ